MRRSCITGVLTAAFLIAAAGSASAGQSAVEVELGNAPGTANHDSTRCTGYEAGKSFIVVNEPITGTSASVGQLYVNSVAQCLS